MVKAKRFLVVGGFILCLLLGCTHYESEPTFGKVPDIVCRYDNKAHTLQLRINRSSGDERRKYTKEQEDLLHKELPQTLRDEKVDEIVGREIPVDCRTDYFSIDKFVITEVDKDGSILLNGKILFNVNFEREYDLGYVGLTTDLCDMAGTAYNSKRFYMNYRFSDYYQAFVPSREATMRYKAKYPKKGETADFHFSIPDYFFEGHYQRGKDLPVKVVITQYDTHPLR